MMAETRRPPIKEGPQTNFAWLVDQGVKAYQRSRGLRNLETVEQEICEKTGIGARTLQRWRHNSLPSRYEDLEHFANVCVEVTPELGKEWVAQLFRAAHMDSEQAIEKIFGREPQESPDVPRVDRTSLLQDYRQWQKNAWHDLRGWSSEPISTLFLMPRLGPGHWMDSKAQSDRAACLFPPDLVERYENMLILGPPGAGKTVLCHHLMVAPLGGDARASLQPIYVRLPDYAPRVEEGEDLVAFAARARAKRQGCSAEALEQALRAQAQAGQLLFLLDGWDEAPGVYREALAEEVRKTGCRYVIAARSEVPDLPFDGIFSLDKLMMEEVHRYIQKWAAWQGAQFKAEAMADLLSQQSSLMALARVPAYLAVMCRIVQEYDGVSKLREWRVLDRVVDRLSKRGVRSSDQLSEPSKKSILADLAYWTYGSGRGYEWRPRGPLSHPRLEQYWRQSRYLDPSEPWRPLSSEHFAELCDYARSSGLLLTQGAGVSETLNFPNEAIQAHLAATYLARQFDDEDRKYRARFLGLRRDGRRVVCLAVGMLGDADPSGQAAINLLSWQAEDKLQLQRVFFVQCLAELDEPLPPAAVRFAQGIVPDLVRLWRAFPSDDLRLAIARALHGIDSPGAAEAMGSVARDNGLAEPERSIALHCLGHLGNTEAQTYLLDMAERWPLAEMLSDLGLRREKATLACALVEALAALRAPKAFEQLEDWACSAKPLVSDAAMRSLARLDSPHTAKFLLQFLDHPQATVRRYGRQYLGGQGSSVAAAMLADKLEQLLATEQEELTEERLDRANEVVNILGTMAGVGVMESLRRAAEDPKLKDAAEKALSRAVERGKGEAEWAAQGPLAVERSFGFDFQKDPEYCLRVLKSKPAPREREAAIRGVAKLENLCPLLDQLLKLLNGIDEHEEFISTPLVRFIPPLSDRLLQGHADLRIALTNILTPIYGIMVRHDIRTLDLQSVFLGGGERSDEGRDDGGRRAIPCRQAVMELQEDMRKR